MYLVLGKLFLRAITKNGYTRSVFFQERVLSKTK